MATTRTAPLDDYAADSEYVWRAEPYVRTLRRMRRFPRYGRVSQVIGLTIEATGPAAEIGEMCRIEPAGGGAPLAAEVVGFREGRTLLMPLGEMSGIGPGSMVVSEGQPFAIPWTPRLLGRVIDGLGRPIDGKGPLPLETGVTHLPVRRPAPEPLSRPRISEPLPVGVKAIDGLLTCGRGQRMGIFAGSGVGKSTLLGMMARHTEADVNCIALIGERGREVGEFLERDLGEEGLRRSVVVVATSDQPALVRIRGAFVATAIAEGFRDAGRDVLLMMDSLTRLSLAQREVGLAIGEPPATKGYPPSVFAMMPSLLERAGMASAGSITGLYTVLVEGDDLSDPIADTARSILDGHIVLSRAIAERQQYPAVDVLASVSRVMGDVVDPSHLEAAGRVKRRLATYREMEDLISVGAYERGTDERVDDAIDTRPNVLAFLEQKTDDGSPWDETVAKLADVAAP